MDDFDRWWQWANKPLESTLTSPTDFHHAITSCRRKRGMIGTKSMRLFGTYGRPAAEIPRYAGREITFQCRPLAQKDPPG